MSFLHIKKIDSRELNSDGSRNFNGGITYRSRWLQGNSQRMLRLQRLATTGSC
jgi:hypothetical protein